MILPIRTHGLPRGVVRGLVGDVWLGEGVGWSSPMVRSASESIYSALYDVPDECAELKCVVKLVDNPERTCPLEP